MAIPLSFGVTVPLRRSRATPNCRDRRPARPAAIAPTRSSRTVRTFCVLISPTATLTAGGVAKVYAALLGQVDGIELVSPERLKAIAPLIYPIQASSGKVTRYRLNRGGDRQANAALWNIVLTRMSSDPRTRAYVERRTKEGLSKGEIMRILKRYVAREVFRYLPRA
jgi:hypothetical protein